MLLYCGFDAHLPFNSISDQVIKPLDDLRWSALQQAGDTTIENAWPGWCALFVATKDQRLFLFNYDSPDRLPHGQLCTLEPGHHVVQLEWSSRQSFVVQSDQVLRRWKGNDINQVPEKVIELVDETSKVLQVTSSAWVGFARTHLIVVLQVAAGTTFACVLFDDGHVKGLELDVPEESTPEVATFRLEHDRFIQIACGNEHMVMLTERGRVYTYGRGSKGQLGSGALDDR